MISLMAVKLFNSLTVASSVHRLPYVYPYCTPPVSEPNRINPVYVNVKRSSADWYLGSGRALTQYRTSNITETFDKKRYSPEFIREDENGLYLNC